MRRNKELTLEITSLCRLNCAFCSTNATPEGKKVPLHDVIASMREHAPFARVLRLSGGEPTLHPELEEILIEANHWLNYHVVLLTNGQIILPLHLRKYVDEYVVHLVNSQSFFTARWLKGQGMNVSAHVVNVRGNEETIWSALRLSLELNIPLHVLALQKQGRGINCEPSQLITWTGIRGCNEGKKITVNVEGKVTTCSAFKNRPCDIDKR